MLARLSFINTFIRRLTVVPTIYWYMKNETFLPTDEMVDTMYKDFCNDPTILSMSALRRKYGYGSKSGRKIQLAIYAKYGEADENLKQIVG